MIDLCAIPLAGLPPAALEPIGLEMAREHGWALAEYCFTNEFGGDITCPKFHEEWHEIYQTTHQATFIGPRDCAKTTQMMARILRILGRAPNSHIKVICAEPDLASRIISAVGEHIEHNPKLRRVYPNLRPDKTNEWSRHALFVQRGVISKEPSLEAWGMFQGSSGGRATHLFFDDPCNWRNSIGTPKLREQVKSAFRENWMNYLIPGGRVGYQATPWHVSDLTAELRSRSDWAHWEKPAIDDRTGWLLWPERLTKEFLDSRRADPREMSSFARQYLLQAVSDEDTTFDREIIEDMFEWSLPVPSVEPQWTIVGGVDIGHRTGEAAAYSVMASAAVLPNGERILLDLWRERLQPVPTWERVADTWRALRHHRVYVENNAYQQAAVDYLQRNVPEARTAIVGFTTGRQKADQEVGLPGLQGRMGAWRIPMGDRAHDTGCACPRCQLRSELLAHPYADYDDCVMAFWFVDRAADVLARGGAHRAVGAIGAARRPTAMQELYKARRR